MKRRCQFGLLFSFRRSRHKSLYPEHECPLLDGDSEGSRHWPDWRTAEVAERYPGGLLRCHAAIVGTNSTSSGQLPILVNHTGMGRATPSVLKAGASDAEAIARVHVTSWREAYRSLLPDKMLSVFNVTDRADRWRQILRAKAEKTDALVAIAVQGNEVVGFVSVGPQRDEQLLSQGFTGEIEAIYVLAKAQRSGVGRTLIGVGANHLFRAGHRSAALWVLEQNWPARSFYKAMGGLEFASRKDTRKDVALAEIAYGWRYLAEVFQPDARNKQF